MNSTALKKLPSRLAFAILAILCIVMAVATITELYKGSEFAHTVIYGSPWFIALWFLLAACGMVHYILRRAYTRLFVTGVHAAFIIILAGALVTHITSKKGYIHLRNGETTEAFIVDNENAETTSKLPFKVTLVKFQISKYQGTDMPSDFESFLKITQSNGETQATSISMNNIFKNQGVRLYQASYDEDLQGSTIAVNYDPIGTPLTYIGYALLFVSMICWLFTKNGMMRKALRSTAAMGAAALLLVMMPQNADAQSQIVISKAQAHEMGKLLINYDGRIAPMETFANDFVRKITDGNTTYKALTAEQIITGWIFYPHKWADEDIISLKEKKLQEYLGLERYTSLTKINAALTMKTPQEMQSFAGKKATDRFSEKLDLIYSLEQGLLIKIYPYKIGKDVKWFSYVDELPRSIPKDDYDFMRMSMTNIYGYILMGQPQFIKTTIDEIAKFQREHGGESLPTGTQLKCEHFLNSAPFTGILFKVNLTAGILALFFAFAYAQKKRAAIKNAFVIISLLTNLVLLGIIILRTIIAGRVPLSNGYETMLAVAWFAQLISLIMCRKTPLLTGFGLISAGFILLVATLQAADPKITPLMPVLASPLLAMHVSVIMIAYAFLTLAFLASVTALAVRKSEMQIRLMNVVKTLLPPALTTLAIGIFVGAVWANVSWGSYWSWDSKEVWALITMLTYSFALHETSFKSLSNPRIFHIFIAIAYLTVIMTYFGVNMILPGMHSYSGM